ncbi:MAG: hypothetical protein GAK45_01457 [Pseudomonas citronellolis]|nr:MAG: hypothetical protein GAK45_01457 [Pseudomonas citronellolis]
MFNTLPSLFAALCLALAGLPSAQAADASMPGMPGMQAPPGSPSTQAFQEGSQRMMRSMAAPYTGDTDQDFVTHMLAHHQGAVDMAQVQLKYGSDPQLRQLAEAIIAAQQKEIVLMQRWQAEHPLRH